MLDEMMGTLKPVDLPFMGLGTDPTVEQVVGMYIEAVEDRFSSTRDALTEILNDVPEETKRKKVRDITWADVDGEDDPCRLLQSALGWFLPATKMYLHKPQEVKDEPERVYIIWWDNGEGVPELYESDISRVFRYRDEAEEFLYDAGFEDVDELWWEKEDHENTACSNKFRAMIRTFELGGGELEPANPADILYSPFDPIKEGVPAPRSDADEQSGMTLKDYIEEIYLPIRADLKSGLRPA